MNVCHTSSEREIAQIRDRVRATSSGSRQFSQNPDIRLNVSSRAAFVLSRIAIALGVVVLVAGSIGAQSRVGPDSADRWTAYGRNMARMSIAGLGYASWDQMWNSPKEWGPGWRAYGKRVASNVGATAIQETVTEGLAAVMNRPLSYVRCKCNGTGQRVAWAARGAFFDQMPNGKFPLAVPRIVGGYVGAYALTTWMPPSNHNRATQTLIDGTMTLGVSVLINLTHEFILR